MAFLPITNCTQEHIIGGHNSTTGIVVFLLSDITDAKT